MKATCFVIQVFDNAQYDRRYEETFAPAIEKAGATPIRADKILGSRPVIEKIETALRGATVAFAEITENNANVFIELGYALDQDIPLVMVCDKAKRASLPFDITHRPVIFYKTESQGDFEQLSRDIEIQVSAAIKEAEDRQRHRQERHDQTLPQPTEDELKTRLMLEVLEAEVGDPDGLSAWRLKKAVTDEGYSERIASLAILGLGRDGLLDRSMVSDRDGDHYQCYQLTDAGRDLLLSRYADLKRMEDRIRSTPTNVVQPLDSKKQAFSSDDLDDDVPF